MGALHIYLGIVRLLVENFVQDITCLLKVILIDQHLGLQEPKSSYKGELAKGCVYGLFGLGIFGIFKIVKDNILILIAIKKTYLMFAKQGLITRNHLPAFIFI